MPDSMTVPVSTGDPLQAFSKRRMSGDERRQQLIDAALHLFATNGFRGTTTKAGLTVDAVLARDFPVVQAVILFFSFVYVLVNLLIDLSYVFLDPRIRY